MRVVQANNTEMINIGRQLENLATEVVFDLSNWIAEFGDGTAALIVRRVGDSNIYPVSLERQDSKAIWKVTNADTELAQKSRYGRCELRWYVGDVLAKSNIWKLYVEPSMTGQSGQVPPSPEQSWVDKVLEAGFDAENAATNAKDSAFEAKASEDNAAKSATDAKAAMTAAQVAQRVAEDAKSVAVQSAQEAAGSASAASTSETNAKASEVLAKASETAAQESKAAAAGSAIAAANSATSASASASAASESATEADASETAAKVSEEAAKASETAAKASETAAAESASSAQQSATSAAESAAVYDDVVADVNQLKQDVAAITPDDSTVDGKPWTSKKIVDSLCQQFEESGNPVQVYPVEGYPLGVKVVWEPVQEGSGDPSPENIRPIKGRDSVKVERCGENLLNIKPFNKFTKNGITFEYVPDGGIHISGTATASADGPVFPFWHLPPGKYYGMNTDAKVASSFVVHRNGEKLWLNSKGTFEILAGDVAKYWYAFVQAGTTIDETIYPYIVPGTTAPTTYTPYIGQTNTLALPETVYGGTLDVESGVVTVEYGHIASYAGDALPGEWISDRDVYSSGAVPTTGAQVVYKLAEPITIQLDPHQISTLSGANTIYTDADGVIVTGAEDPKHTITELKNAIISLGGNI